MTASWQRLHNEFNPFNPKSDRYQISPAASPHIVSSHSMKNLAFQSLLRWKMENIHFSFNRLGECTFWAWERKVWKVHLSLTEYPSSPPPPPPPSPTPTHPLPGIHRIQVLSEAAFEVLTFNARRLKKVPDHDCVHTRAQARCQLRWLAH